MASALGLRLDFACAGDALWHERLSDLFARLAEPPSPGQPALTVGALYARLRAIGDLVLAGGNEDDVFQMAMRSSF